MFAGIADLGMIAPGWHTTTPAKSMSGARGIDRIRTLQPRREIGRRKTVARRRGIDDLSGNGFGPHFMRPPSNRKMLAGSASFKTASGLAMRANRAALLSPG